MSILNVKNRDFQRATGEWLRKARQGFTVIILSSTGPPLTLQAGRPPRGETSWDDHFEWLKSQPQLEINPVDEIRRSERR